MTITLTQPIREAGAVVAAGATITRSADVEADLVARGFAIQIQPDPVDKLSPFRADWTGKIFKDGSSIAGWSLTAGVTVANVAKPVGGPQSYRTNFQTCMRISTTSANGSITIGALSTGPVGYPRVDLWVYIEDHAAISSFSLYFATNSSFTDYYLKTVVPRAYNGWQMLTLDLSVGSPTGSPTYETITNFKLLITASSAAGASIILDRVVICSGGRTKCALIFDDGNTSDLDFAVPLLNKYGILANFALIASVSPLEQFKKMAYSGHRLLVHGANSLTNLATMQDVEDDIKANQDWVKNLGGFSNDSDVYVYPYGAFLRSTGDAKSIPNLLRKMGFIGAYTVGNQRITPDRGIDRYLLPRVDLKASTVAATLLSNIDQYIDGGWCFCLMIHRVLSSGATGDNVDREVFDDVLSGIRSRVLAGKLDICSARDLIMYSAPSSTV